VEYENAIFKILNALEVLHSYFHKFVWNIDLKMCIKGVSIKRVQEGQVSARITPGNMQEGQVSAKTTSSNVQEGQVMLRQPQVICRKGRSKVRQPQVICRNGR